MRIWRREPPAQWLKSYWDDASRPLPSLIFVLPLLACYEAGLCWLGPHAMRNGADAWLRLLLQGLGISQYFFLPLLTCGLLLAWHHLRVDEWKIRGQTLYGMLVESILFGSCLLVVALLQRTLWSSAPILSMDGGRLVSYLGAGIYEELLFRLLLVPVLFTCFRWVAVPTPSALVSAIVASSVLFAAAHYRLDFQSGLWELKIHGEVFDSGTFCFRMIAGCFFAGLFWLRGFGVAVGAHAAYDILAAYG